MKAAPKPKGKATLLTASPEDIRNKCVTEGCSHLTPNEYCKTCTRLLSADKMLHPNLCWPDHGGGVNRWMDDDSEDALEKGQGDSLPPAQRV